MADTDEENEFKKRRAFVRAENMRLGKFLNVDHLVGWRRTYRCDCGFKCNAPGEIFDHAQSCKVSSLV